jgi:aryl-alcohol dehydrogenase-like predicted oxidoreductase
MLDSMDRRDVLRTLAAAAAGATIGRRLMGKEDAPAKITRPIPKSGETIPVIGLGTYRVFDVGSGAKERAAATNVLQELVAAGGHVVDSSPMYGRAETVVGDIATEAGLRDRLFLASKVWTTGRDAGVAQVDSSLRRMGAGRLDLMQVHNLVDLKTQLSTLRKLKAAGRVRYVGVSHWTESAYAELESVLRNEDLDFVQLNYSIVEREAEARLLPLAIERRIAVIVNRPFAQGGLFERVKGKPLPDWAASFDAASWGQLFLKFVVSHPAVTCTIPATAKVEHLRDNMAAGVGRLPDPETRERMAAILSR